MEVKDQTTKPYVKAYDGSEGVRPTDCKRIRCLDSRQAGLQSYSEDRIVSQLVESVVVISKLLDKHFPASWVQKILWEVQIRRIR